MLEEPNRPPPPLVDVVDDDGCGVLSKKLDAVAPVVVVVVPGVAVGVDDGVIGDINVD